MQGGGTEINMSKKSNEHFFRVDFYDGTEFPYDKHRLHSHEYNELSIIEYGDITYCSDNGTYKLLGKSIIFSRAYQLHNPYVDGKKPYKRYQVFFDYSFLSDLFVDKIPFFLTNSFVANLSDDDFDELSAYMKILHKSYKNNNGSKEALLSLQLLLSSILLKVNTLKRINDPLPNTSSDYIDKVILYIHENCGKKLTIQSIASEFFVSRTKLMLDFKKYTGMTTNNYIILAKLSVAKKYLHQGCSIQKCASLCGFSSAEYFIKTFSKFNGITPAQYKRRQ